MKTPHDDFEHALQQLRLRELPAHWKQEILTQAEMAAQSRFSPPRSFLIALAAAWIAIITLNVLTPAGDPPLQTQAAAAFAPSSLFALNQHLDLLQP